MGSGHLDVKDPRLLRGSGSTKYSVCLKYCGLPDWFAWWRMVSRVCLQFSLFDGWIYTGRGRKSKLKREQEKIFRR